MSNMDFIFGDALGEEFFEELYDSNNLTNLEVSRLFNNHKTIKRQIIEHGIKRAINEQFNESKKMYLTNIIIEYKKDMECCDKYDVVINSINNDVRIYREEMLFIGDNSEIELPRLTVNSELSPMIERICIVSWKIERRKLRMTSAAHVNEIRMLSDINIDIIGLKIITYMYTRELLVDDSCTYTDILTKNVHIVYEY